MEIEFNKDDSFEALVSGPMLKPRKPEQVPDLDLDQISEYQTCDEGEEGEASGAPDSSYQNQPEQDQEPTAHDQYNYGYNYISNHHSRKQ